MEQIEGRICVDAALKARRRKITLLLIRSGLHLQQFDSILKEAEEQHVPVKYVSAAEIDAMAHGKTHGGVIALATPKPALDADRLFDQLKKLDHPAALLLLEGIDDSQNFGFTLRSAEATGMDAILLKKHLWDFDNNAVSRASSGAYERMSIVHLDQAEIVLLKFKRLGIIVLGCIANARKSLYEADLTQPFLLAIGGEKRGLSAGIRSLCDTFVKIPMMRSVGSLSLSHSASIIMAEAMRQRLLREAGDLNPSVSDSR